MDDGTCQGLEAHATFCAADKNLSSLFCSFFLSTELVLHEFCQHPPRLQLNLFYRSPSIAILVDFIVFFLFFFLFLCALHFYSIELAQCPEPRYVFFPLFFSTCHWPPHAFFSCSMSPNFHTLSLLTLSRQICTFSAPNRKPPPPLNLVSFC